MSEGGKGETDEMRRRLKHYLQNKRGIIATPAGVNARTASGKVVKASQTNQVVTAKVPSLKPKVQQATNGKFLRVSQTREDPCTKVLVSSRSTVSNVSPWDLSQARLRHLHRLVRERPEFAPPVIESVAHFVEVVNVGLYRKAMTEMSMALGPVVEWVKGAVERLLDLHHRITHEQQAIIHGMVPLWLHHSLSSASAVESEDLHRLMVDFLAYKRRAELAMELTNHLPEWKTLKQELEALFSHVEALHKVTDAHNNYLTLNSI